MILARESRGIDAPMVHRSNKTGRRRSACYGVSVSVHAAILVVVGGLFAAHAGTRGRTVVAAIEWEREARTEPYCDSPEEPLRELQEEPIEEEPLVRETVVESSKPTEIMEFSPLDGSIHGLIRKTHWREAREEVEPVRELAVVEPPSRTERVPAAPCTNATGTVDASPLEAPPPVYPAGSLRAREEGTVTLTIVIGSGGRTVSAQVKESSGFRRLDRAALEAVECWRFHPALIAGVPIQSTLLHRITFQLQNH